MNKSAVRPTPFQIAIGDDVLDDLVRRLDLARWPDQPADAQWQYGIDLRYLQKVALHWRNQFDWRAAEERLNALPQYRVPVDFDGQTLDIHFVMQAGSGSAPRPLLLTHGWPSSFVEYSNVVERLTHPERFGGREEDAFTVIIPSLPGTLFSQKPACPMTPRRIASGWRNLMVDILGHSQFQVQGGDWGAVVSSWLAIDYPEHVEGVHLTMLGIKPHVDAANAPLSDAEKAWIKTTQKRLAADGGYREVQATKPTTVGVGLADSPIAAASWIIEKYHGWSGPADAVTPPYSVDELLTIITLFWATNSLPTANWIYWADRNDRDSGLIAGQRCAVPTGTSFFGQGFFPNPPDEWIQRGYDLVYRNDHLTGGHFPALLKPEIFAQEVSACFNKMRDDATRHAERSGVLKP